MLGLRFQISAKSFYQINPIQTEVLYRKAIELAGLTGKETVIDVYCGTGTIGLSAASKAKRVIGIEIVPSAVEDAKNNAVRNGITNAEFICGDAGACT
ncbi:MAG: methyltransferase domain-containing protein, partial [Holdemania massiliensis]